MILSVPCGILLSATVDFESSNSLTHCTEIFEDFTNESILAHAPTRSQFLDDIFELEAFLQHRKEDLSDTKGKAAALLDPMQVVREARKREREKRGKREKLEPRNEKRERGEVNINTSKAFVATAERRRGKGDQRIDGTTHKRDSPKTNRRSLRDNPKVCTRRSAVATAGD